MKKLLLLFAVLLTTVGAWAQEVVTYINVNNVYKLHCMASSHAAGTPQGKYLADDANGNILGRSDEGTYFCFEKADGENQYYIKNVNTGKYIKAAASSNAPVTTSTDKADATVWTLGVPAHTTGVVTFGLPGDFYLNNNGLEKDQYLKANYHNGGPAANNACSLWKLEDHGPLVTFVNVQKDGTKYGLYINNGALDKTKLTGETTIESLGDNAKFVATKLANGKYTFYNLANKVYMIWRGKSGGHNGDKGVLETYNSEYCDWEIVSSHGDGRVGTMSLYGKRGNKSNGSLILLSNGSFDAYGHSLGWDSGFSNVFQIDNLAHFTYTFKHDGETKGTQESFIAPLGNVYPAPKTLPAYVTTNSIPVGFIDASTKEQSYDVAVEYNLPFKVSENFANAKWYYMNIRTNSSNGGPYKWLSSSETIPYTQSKEFKSDYSGQWAFVGNPFDGIKILNRYTGDGTTLAKDPDNSNVYMRNGETSWFIEEGNGGFALHVTRADNQYINDVNSTLAIWNNASAKTDGGSAFNVLAIEDNQFYQVWGNHYPWTSETVQTLPEGLKLCSYDEEGIEHSIKKAETTIDVTGNSVSVTFKFTNGTSMLMIAGVDLVKKDGSVVKTDYHQGKSGGQLDRNTYTLTGVEPGEYTLRYFVCEKKGGSNGHDLTATNGYIVVDGATRSNVDVKYVFTLEGEEKLQSEPISSVPGGEYPNVVDVFPYGIYASKPSGTIVDSEIVNGLVTKTIQMEERLPFYKSTSFKEATWYVVDMHSYEARYVWTYVPDATTPQHNVQLPIEGVQTELFGDEKYWCFIGNAYDGFKIYNKAAGENLTLNKPEDNNTPAWMSDAASATSYHLVPTTSVTKGSFCFLPKGHTYYLNTQKPEGVSVKILQGWDDSDEGSSCRFFTPTDFIEEAILANYNPEAPWGAVGSKTVLGDSGVREMIVNTLSAIQADGWNADVITPEVSEAIVSLIESGKVEMAAGYYFIKGTGDGHTDNKSTWYVTYDSNQNLKAVTPAQGEKLGTPYIWRFDSSDEGKYKLYSCNIGKYSVLKGAPDPSPITGTADACDKYVLTDTGFGKFQIKSDGGKNFRTEGDGTINEWGSESNETWYIVPATELDITITNAGWATTCLPFDVVLPEELTAYALTGVDNLNGEETGTVSLISKAGIKANEGALLKGAPGTYTLSIEETASNWEANMLSGTTVAKDMSTLTGDVYLLTAGGENSAKLSKLVLADDATEAKKTLAANKAYLNIATSSARFLVFNFDEDNETAIESIGSEDGNMKEEIYDLVGRRVQNAQKGLYIVNGKKVIK